MSNLKDFLGKHLNILRLKKGVTQEDLARVLGIEKAMVSHYETGKALPSIEVLALLCEYFNITADYFLFESALPISKNRKIDDEIKLLLPEINKLSDDDKKIVINLVKSLLSKK